MKSIKSLPQKYYKHGVLGMIALLIWLVTFYTDTKIFTGDPLNMNCLPIDTETVLFMRILTKVLVLLIVWLFLEFLVFAYKRPTLLIPFLVLMFIYVVGLLLSWPGYFMSDDSIIFAYSTRYYPVYWHNYLTSLFYTTAMSLFPASWGPVLLSDILYALTYSYIFYEGHRLFKTKWKYLLLIPGILPFTLLGALMSFRPALYSSFFLFFFAFLFFEYKKKARITWFKLTGIGFFTALLGFWRSEGIVLLIFIFFILPCVYSELRFSLRNASLKKNSFRNHSFPLLKKYAFFLLCLLTFFIIIKAPQSAGEKKYYGSDYLIISTTRPLSVIVHREQTYPGAEEDLANINAVTEFGYLHNDSLSCSAYNRYNTDHNAGKYTETGASPQLQKAYLQSALRLITHNLDLYFGERLQLFLVTNGIFDYNTDIVLNLKPVVSTGFHLYDHDRAYGYELIEHYSRILLPARQEYVSSLFEFGGEAYIPMLVILLGTTLWALFSKRWFFFFALLSLWAREAVIFLTAPASFIQYSYPMMYVTAALALFMLVETVQTRLTNTVKE